MTSSGAFSNNSWPFLFNTLVVFLGGGGSLRGGGLTLDDLGVGGMLGDIGNTLAGKGGGGVVLQVIFFLHFFDLFLSFSYNIFFMNISTMSR